MYLVALVVFLADQVSKYYVLRFLRLDIRLAIDVIPPYFNLRMAWNTGINFGWIASEQDLTRWILIGVALMITIWVVWWMTREHRTIARVAAGFLIGGALGNVVDRLVYGAVADFINTSCCGIDNPFAYNIADIAIFAGAIGLILFTGERKTA